MKRKKQELARLQDEVKALEERQNAADEPLYVAARKIISTGNVKEIVELMKSNSRASERINLFVKEASDLNLRINISIKMTNN